MYLTQAKLRENTGNFILAGMWPPRCISFCERLSVVYGTRFLPSATVVAEWLCFHRCLSVDGGCTPPKKTHGETPPCQADSLSVHRGVVHQADIPCQAAPPPRWLLQRTVPILLECILVNITFINLLK